MAFLTAHWGKLALSAEYHLPAHLSFQITGQSVYDPHYLQSQLLLAKAGGCEEMGERALLSPREAECLRLVLELRTSKAIARRLGLQPGSVDKYLQGASRKLGASDRFDAAARLWRYEQPGRTMPPFGVSQSTGIAEDLIYDDPQGSRDGDCPPPASVVHEAPPTFEAQDALPGTRGRYDSLSGPERLALYVRYGVIVLLAFMAFCVGLLVLSTAARELHLL